MLHEPLFLSEMPSLEELEKTHVRFEISPQDLDNHLSWCVLKSDGPIRYRSLEFCFDSKKGEVIYLTKKDHYIYYSQGINMTDGRFNTSYGKWIPKELAHYGVFHSATEPPKRAALFLSKNRTTGTMLTFLKNTFLERDV